MGGVKAAGIWGDKGSSDVDELTPNPKPLTSMGTAIPPLLSPFLPMQGSHFHLPKSLPSAAITSSTSPSLYLPTEMLLPHPSYLPRYKEQERRKQKHTPWCY